jgi:hypothetical protein
VEIFRHWAYVNGEWVPGWNFDEPQSSNSVHFHPDGPQFGAHWLKGRVSFTKAKLTNKISCDEVSNPTEKIKKKERNNNREKLLGLIGYRN